MNSGKLIAFEGIDGCGKSTQVGLAAAVLRTRGVDLVETREPTDGVWGQKIRAMARSGVTVPPQTELEWFFQDRREHMRDVVEPAIAAGKIVLTDRSYLSTVAYQGARGLDPAEILAASEAEFRRPDLVLLFVLSADQGMERVRARGEALETVFEELAYQRGVEEAFDALEFPEITRIDADRDPEIVAIDVFAAIEPLLL